LPEFALIPGACQGKSAVRAKPRYWDRRVAMLDAWTDTPHGPCHPRAAEFSEASLRMLGL